MEQLVLIGLLSFTILIVESYKILNDDLKIVGGNIASIQDYPYLISFQIFDQQICGGAIINPFTILTAGHCVNGYYIIKKFRILKN